MRIVVTFQLVHSPTVASGANLNSDQDEMTEFSDTETSSSMQKVDVGIKPKVEALNFDLPSENVYSRIMGDNVASSSGSNVRSSLIGMGFTPCLVDRAIKENGEDNVDLLLETLFTYSALQKPKSEHADSVDGFFEDTNKLPADFGATEALHISDSSDSFDNLFGDDEETCSHSNHNTDVALKEEPDVDNVESEKKASLVAMSFSKDEVEFAMDKLGVDAPISELVDFIFAARMADNFRKETDDTVHSNAEKDQQCSTEALFGTMEKTLMLFEMGFSEQQISIAIEKCGSEVPVSELAASIVAEEDASIIPSIKTDKSFPEFASTTNSTAGSHCSLDPSVVKAEEDIDDISLRNFEFLEKLKGKRPKEKYTDEPFGFKRPKQEYDEDSSSSLAPTWFEARHKNSISFRSYQTQASKKVHQRAEQIGTSGMDNMPMPKLCRNNAMVAKPPYFFYGNVTNLNHDSWVKISQFLYSQPEFVKTQIFSALSRTEGYVHNLPTENRFHILPKSPMTIEEAIPHTRKWWPSWDTRKQLSCISCETTLMSQASERLGRMLDSRRGLLSVEQQADLLHKCQMLNLVWVGPHKLAPVELEDLERILGYPVHYTRFAGFSLTERLQSLTNCFQIDTVAYHLSVLKSLFPEGLTILSIYSGIGGAEIALYKLGIQLKVVVSVEPCERKRKIFKQWWEKHGLSGELVQMESLRSRLASNKLEALINKYNGFDVVIGQNPCTYSSKSSGTNTDRNNISGLHFQLFYEFVRALQRVRSIMEKNR